MSSENSEIVARIYAAWQRGDFAAGVPLFADDAVLVIDPEMPDPGAHSGTAGIREYMSRFLDAWESLTIAAASIESAGDHVLVEVAQAAVGIGSGATTTMRYFQVWTLRDGQVIRLESVKDETRARAMAGVHQPGD
jgi:ketosteroid isomerase-like protein